MKRALDETIGTEEAPQPKIPNHDGLGEDQSLHVPVEDSDVAAPIPMTTVDIFSQLEPISGDPIKIHSHFTRVSEANRKGQARFQCLKCGHEFECSGRKRLVQHILGYSHQANRYKNVRACSSPYGPLKEELMKIYPKHIPAEGERKRRRRRRKEEIIAAQLIAELSKQSQPSSSRSFNSHNKTGYGSNLVDGFGFGMNSLHEDIEDTEQGRSDQNRGMPSNGLHYLANQTLYQFLANHGLPVSMVEDHFFKEFMNAVRLAGEDYQPTTQSVIQDNIISLLLSKTPSTFSQAGSHLFTSNQTNATLITSSSANNLTGNFSEKLLLSSSRNPERIIFPPTQDMVANSILTLTSLARDTTTPMPFSAFSSNTVNSESQEFPNNYSSDGNSASAEPNSTIPISNPSDDGTVSN